MVVEDRQEDGIRYHPLRRRRQVAHRRITMLTVRKRYEIVWNFA
jgi:hypothetical protein